MAVAALANNALAAAGGVLINGMITLRAISLLVAIALIFAGVAGFIRQKDEADMGSTWKTGPFVTTAACFFLLEFGDKTQFLTAALAAQYDAFALAAAGATAGVVIANTGHHSHRRPRRSRLAAAANPLWDRRILPSRGVHRRGERPAAGLTGPSSISHISGGAPMRSGIMLVPSPAPTIRVLPPSLIRPQA
jgi:hypothetical protein